MEWCLSPPEICRTIIKLKPSSQKIKCSLAAGFLTF
ncbi:hypothetical protein DS745_07375 [Anaerobacillus alkaliphilus]|uniref:Uncharacterized protein n=1 Tax=Anaerobacillus alkaliphilus TaxID=1548597 RepID=A0A4Q0VVE5_9BACI|nr:hypothetical protein DS745_07375 [Anaerobacillus alkaliphilus]